MPGRSTISQKLFPFDFIAIIVKNAGSYANSFQQKFFVSYLIFSGNIFWLKLYTKKFHSLAIISRNIFRNPEKCYNRKNIFQRLQAAR